MLESCCSNPQSGNQSVKTTPHGGKLGVKWTDISSPAFPQLVNQSILHHIPAEKGKPQNIQKHTARPQIDFRKTSLEWFPRMKLYSNDMHVSVTVPLVPNPSTYDSNVGQTSTRRSFGTPPTNHRSGIHALSRHHVARVVLLARCPVELKPVFKTEAL